MPHGPTICTRRLLWDEIAYEFTTIEFSMVHVSPLQASKYRGWLEASMLPIYIWSQLKVIVIKVWAAMLFISSSSITKQRWTTDLYIFINKISVRKTKQPLLLRTRGGTKNRVCGMFCVLEFLCINEIEMWHEEMWQLRERERESWCRNKWNWDYSLVYVGMI